MKNPLRKRVIRKLSDEWIKYLALVVFLAMITGFCSATVIITDDLATTHRNVQNRYGREYGNFTVNQSLNNRQIKALEKDNRLHIEESFYVDSSAGKNKNIRIYRTGDRERINQIDLFEGRLPVKRDEMVVDRLYCMENNLSIGDSVELSGGSFTITGLAAFPDYSCLFEDNRDLIFDAKNFAVAAVTGKGFKELQDNRICRNYSWIYDKDPGDHIRQKERADDFMENLVESCFKSGNAIVDFTPSYLNKAITFTDDDFIGDKSITLVFLYVLIVIIAFIFVVEVSGEIQRESVTIGVMKSMGFTADEITLHFIWIPVMVTVAGAILGNIGGYTFFANLIEKMYFGSYSLTETERSFNLQALILTTIVPALIIFLVTWCIIRVKLKHSPLDFLNRNLERSASRAIPLRGGFIGRYRKRIILNSKALYVVLFVGILFANWMLFYGTMMQPMLDHHEKQVADRLISKYRYHVEPGTDVSGGEKFTAYVMNSNMKKIPAEEVTLYGIDENSRFFDDKTVEKFDQGKVLVSTSLAEKYGIKKGDRFKLKEMYEKAGFSLICNGQIDQPEGISIYMSRKKLNNLIEKEDDWYNGCYSNHKLNIPDKQVISLVTLSNLQKTTRQLTRSMSGFFAIMDAVAVAIYILVIYLLSREVVERNRKDISLVRVLGYSDFEIRRLYIIPTRIMFTVFLLLNMPIGIKMAEISFKRPMRDIRGWFSFYAPRSSYIKLFVVGMITYLVVEQIVYRKIKSISMNEVISED